MMSHKETNHNLALESKVSSNVPATTDVILLGGLACRSCLLPDRQGKLKGRWRCTLTPTVPTTVLHYIRTVINISRKTSSHGSVVGFLPGRPVAWMLNAAVLPPDRTASNKLQAVRWKKEATRVRTGDTAT